MNLELLLKQARQAAGDVPLGECDTSEIQLRAVEAIECGISDDDWAAVAEGLAMAHEVLARLAEKAPVYPMRSRQEVDLARQVLGRVMMDQRDTFFRGAYAACCWVIRHHPTDETFADLLARAAEEED